MKSFFTELKTLAQTKNTKEQNIYHKKQIPISATTKIKYFSFKLSTITDLLIH